MVRPSSYLARRSSRSWSRECFSSRQIVSVQDVSSRAWSLSRHLSLAFSLTNVYVYRPRICVDATIQASPIRAELQSILLAMSSTDLYKPAFAKIASQEHLDPVRIVVLLFHCLCPSSSPSPPSSARDIKHQRQTLRHGQLKSPSPRFSLFSVTCTHFTRAMLARSLSPSGRRQLLAL